MTSTRPTAETMILEIEQAINREAERIREAFIKEAVWQYEQELRKAIAMSAMSVSEFYEMSRHEKSVIIKVRHS